MTFEEHTSARHLVQVLREDDFARKNIATKDGIRRSSFSEAVNERPFVHELLEPGQTGVIDRGYQHHKNFDDLQDEQKYFVCRIKANTHKTCLEQYDLPPGIIVFYDAKADRRPALVVEGFFPRARSPGVPRFQGN